MNILDPIVNLVEISIPASYDDTDTTITASLADVARLPVLEAGKSFLAVWGNIKAFPDIQNDPNVEIGEITNVDLVTGEISITRGQGDTSASTKNTVGGNYILAVAVTKETFETIDEYLTIAKRTDDNLKIVNEPSGFKLNFPDTLGDISFSESTREFKIEPKSGQSDFSFLNSNVDIIKTSAETFTISDVSGMHFIYYDENNDLAEELTRDESLLLETVFVAVVYWNAVTGYAVIFGNERHGSQMDGATHLSLHENFGTQYSTGLAIEGLVNATPTFSNITAGEMRDEDLAVIMASQTTTEFLYMLGADRLWYKTTADNQIGYNGGSGDTYFNEWSGTEMVLTRADADHDFIPYHIIATNDIGSPFKTVIGQEAYATRALAREAISNEIYNLVLTGLPSPEFIFIGSYIVKRNGDLKDLADGSTHVDFRSSPPKGIGSSSSVVYGEDVKVLDVEGYFESTDVETILAEVGQEIHERDSTGLVSGGAITDNGDNDVNISAGIGYIDTTTNKMKRIVWDAFIDVDLPFNGSNHIYIDTDGNHHITATESSTTDYIYLGYVFTISSNSDIGMIASNPLYVGDFQRRLNYMVDKVIGVIVEHGNIVGENATDLRLDITSGTIHSRLSEIETTDTSSFTKWYSTAGVWAEDTGNLSVVSTSQYNNLTTGLVSLTTDYWKKDLVLRTLDGGVHYIYGQEEYSTEELAKEGSIPTIPGPLEEAGVAYLAVIISQEGDTSIEDRLADVRPNFDRVFGFGTSGTVGAVADHGSLSGLGDDDHTQYLLTTGARAMTGNLDLGGNDIINADSITADSLTINNYTLPTVDGTADQVMRTDGSGAVTWETIVIPDASEAVKGIIEIATKTEAIAGTDTARAVTPEGVQAHSDYSDGWLKKTAVIPTRASEDDPTYVLTFAGVDLTGVISEGMKVKFMQNGTLRQFFISATPTYASSNSTVTIYGGTDYDVLDTTTYPITDVYFSHTKAPFGFPLDEDKWSIVVTDSGTHAINSPDSETLYNNGSISIIVPIGIFYLGYKVLAGVSNTTAVELNIAVTLSDANNTESDEEFTTFSQVQNALNLYCMASAKRKISTTSKKTYYLNQKTEQSGLDNIFFLGGRVETELRAVCAYL